MFIHDVQVAALRSTNPLISHAELDLPFPFSRKLWDAKTAPEWKRLYLDEISETSPAITSLASSLKDMSSMARFPIYADFRLAALASIHGISKMISDCNQTRNGPSGQWSAMVIKLWQQELQQVLEQFEIVAVKPLQHSMPKIALIYQTVSLSLHLPLHTLERFSGEDWETRSSDACLSFIQHIGAPNMRQASWHAGQVLRITKILSPGSLTGFSATCLYFAALALWSFSTISSSNGMALDFQPKDSEIIFVLDGEADSDALRRFTVFGQGTPVLSSTGKRVSLNDRAAVMSLFQQVLRSTSQGGTSNQQMKALSYRFSMLENDETANTGKRKRKTPGS